MTTRAAAATQRAAFTDRRRGRIRKAAHWVLRSPVRMLAIISMLVGVPVMAYGQVVADNAQHDFGEAELTRVTDGAAAGGSLVADRLASVTFRTESITSTTQLRDAVGRGDAGGLESQLAGYLPLYARDVQRLFVLDDVGRYVAGFPTQRELQGVDYGRTDTFLGATNPWHPFVSPVYPTDVTNHSAEVTIAVPVYNDRGAPIGLLCAAIDLSRAHEWLAPITQLFDVVYVVDQRGLVIFGDWRIDPTPLRDLRGDPNVEAAMQSRTVRVESDDVFSGARRFLSASHVPGLGWSVFVADSPLPTAQRLALLTDGLLILRLILLGLLVTGGVVLSLTTLRQQRIAMENLTRLNKIKSDFVSVVSHEFRTPLTGIQGFSEMIRDESVTMEEAKEFANDINLDAHRLARLITEMLDLDRMESGRMSTNRERVDLVASIRETAERMGATASDHQIVFEIEPGLPKIWADRDRVTQVLTNLISNAIKYSPDGGVITITATTDKAMAHIKVRDQGMGIPSGSLEEVFDRYSRLQTTKTRAIQGTGLGLPIVREICKLHGGRAWVESTVGVGSTFHVTLPIDLRGES